MIQVEGTKWDDLKQNLREVLELLMTVWEDLLVTHRKEMESD